MKTSKRKKIIAAVQIFIMLNVIACPIATKIIYDSMFPRHDESVQIPSEFNELYASRKEDDFMSGDNRLSGYFYPSDQKDVLVVVNPGFNSSCDKYIPQIRDFHEQGYGVYTFDNTGCCSSEGDSSVGFEQALMDLDKALDHLESEDMLGYDKLVLFGHSRGGYAVSNISLFGHDIDAVVSVAGINSAMEGIMEPAVEFMGKFAYSNYPMLYLYQLFLFDDDYVTANAVEAFKDADIPTLVIHGSKDETVALNEYSVYSHMAEIEKDNDDVTFYLSEAEGANGHSDLLRDYEGEGSKAVMSEVLSFIAENVR